MGLQTLNLADCGEQTRGSTAPFRSLARFLLIPRSSANRKVHMMSIIRKWLASLEEADRDLKRQGYTVVSGAGTVFVVRVDSEEKPPRHRRSSWFWSAALAALGIKQAQNLTRDCSLELQPREA